MICVKTGKEMKICPHCLGSSDYVDINVEEEIEYEIIKPVFRSNYRGVCAVDRRHNIKVRDLVAKVQRKDNPLLVISGVACRNCTILLPIADQ